MTANEMEAVISLLRSYYEVSEQNASLCGLLEACRKSGDRPPDWRTFLGWTRSDPAMKAKRMQVEAFLSELRQLPDETQVIAKIVETLRERPPD